MNLCAEPELNTFSKNDMKYQAKLKDNLNIFYPNTESATLEEIESIEKIYNICIPQSMKDFFILVGNDYDCIFLGIGACKLSHLDYNKELSIRLLKECNVIIEKEYFAFASYSGDQFMFVYLCDGEDPPVYRFELELHFCGDDYISGSSTWGYPKGISKVADSFSGLIDEIIDYEIKGT